MKNCLKDKDKYLLEIAGLKRYLPIVELNSALSIASFVMLGDTELNLMCGAHLAARLLRRNFDYVVVPEAKSIALAQSLCDIIRKDYIVLRKSVKSYMNNPLIQKVNSITTQSEQILVIDERDAEKIAGKNVCTVDDVVSTGSSYGAMVDLVHKAGAKIDFAAAVLREGDFDIKPLQDRIGSQIYFLGRLPLFKK